MIQISNFIEFAPQFLAVDDPPEKFLVNELLPEAVAALFHGEPRLKKSSHSLSKAGIGTSGSDNINFGVGDMLILVVR